MGILVRIFNAPEALEKRFFRSGHEKANLLTAARTLATEFVTQKI
jgi:hypothetical protein